MDRREFIKTALLAALALFLPKRAPVLPAVKSEDTLFGIPIVWIDKPGLKENDVVLGDFDPDSYVSRAEHWLDAVTYVSGEDSKSVPKVYWLNQHEKCTPLGIVGKAVELTDNDDLSIHVRFTEQSEAWRFIL